MEKGNKRNKEHTKRKLTMEKVIEDIVKIVDLKNLDKKDIELIENYVLHLHEKFKFLENLQNKVLEDKDKLSKFTKLVETYSESKNGQRKIKRLFKQ